MSDKPKTEQEIHEHEKSIMETAGHLGCPHVIMVERDDCIEPYFIPIGAITYITDAVSLIEHYIKEMEIVEVRRTVLLEQLSGCTFSIPDLDLDLKAKGINLSFKLVPVPDIKHECMKNPGYKYLEHFVAQHMSEDSLWAFTIGSKQANGCFSFFSKVHAPKHPEGLINILTATIKSIADQKHVTTDNLLDAIRHTLLRVKTVEQSKEIIH